MPIILWQLLSVVFSHWRVFAVLALVAAVPAAYGLGHWRGKAAGLEQARVKMAVAAATAERQRKGDDARLQSLTDYDLCTAGLRGSGLPVDACDELRGVRQEQP